MYTLVEVAEHLWGISHPKRYPIEKNFTQVHHFKWDYSVLQRLKQVIKSTAVEAFAHEYKKMLSAIEYLDDRMDLSNIEYMFQRVESPEYSAYRYWDRIIKKNINV
jgi:hypothetical protein